MGKKIKFSICLPIFANPGMLSFRTPNYKKLNYSDLKKLVKKCDDSNLDSIFIADHTFLGNKGEIFECTALMAAFAALTKRINIGSIHLANNFRHPAIVAKFFSTLSHISNGRIILFYDYAWRGGEFKQTGISFEDTNKRVSKMIEGLKIIKKSFKDEKINFNGKYYKVKNFICNPKPVKKIPIWLGESDNKLMVKEIVKNADVYNSMPCNLNVFKKKIEIIKEECRKQNKSFNRIGKSLETQIMVVKDDEDLKKKIINMKKNKIYNKTFDHDIIARLRQINKSDFKYDNIKTLKEEFFVGTIYEIRQKIKQFSNLGVNHFMFWPMDFPKSYTLDKLINEIV
tara:strand:- start:1896 stop:2921 length:1026 start_codon:yes stop_codon:yes gene_type:complete